MYGWLALNVTEDAPLMLTVPLPTDTPCNNTGLAVFDE
jgi:hypothetical protein